MYSRTCMQYKEDLRKIHEYIQFFLSIIVDLFRHRNFRLKYNYPPFSFRKSTFFWPGAKIFYYLGEEFKWKTRG
jgi:hypothetical protein